MKPEKMIVMTFLNDKILTRNFPKLKYDVPNHQTYLQTAKSLNIVGATLENSKKSSKT